MSTTQDDAIVPLIDNIIATDFGALPTVAVDAVKRHTLDAVAITIAGATAPACAETVALLQSWGGTPQSTVMCYGHKLPAHQAVIANVMMCHALELDDLHDQSIAHATAPSVWSAFAAAEAMGGASGRDFITAVALASDLMCRLCLAADRSFELGYHKALFAGFAACAATGKLNGLDAETLRHALGITFSQAGASVQCLPDGALMKRLQPALNASNGMRSIGLANAGVTGIRNVLEGPYGVYALFNHSKCDRDALLDGLGRRFMGAEISIKRYPSSRCCHGPVQATLELIGMHDVRAADVDQVELLISEGCYHVSGDPFTKRTGSPEVDAQFNISYNVAAAILWGEVFIDQMQASAAENPEVRALSDKVTVGIEPTQKGIMRFAPLTVRLRTTDGRAFSHTLDKLKGTPEDPMNWDEIVEERLQRCLPYALKPIDDARVAELLDLLSNLETLDDVRRIISVLTPT